MSTKTDLSSRVLRRELHSSKAGLAITLAVLVILASGWVGTESVLAALSQPPLLMSPADIAAGVRGLAGVQAGVLIGAGAVLAVIGVLLVIGAVSPGRRGRHVITSRTSAAVVGDEVIGSALVQVAASVAGISPDRAVATVGLKSATVRLTPNSGVPIDRAAVQAALDDEAATLPLTPRIRPRVTIDTKGKVGG